MSKGKKREIIVKNVTFCGGNHSAAPEGVELDLTVPGVHVGQTGQEGTYIGIPQDADGNALVVGGVGSGKSTGVAKPTLATWTGSAYILDVKGELTQEHQRLRQLGLVQREAVVLDFDDPTGPSYDPFQWLEEDGEENLVRNAQDLVESIIPTPPSAPEPFWTQAEQQILAAAILYFWRRGLSFSETAIRILAMDIVTLCKELATCDDARVRILLGKVDDNPKLLASIDRGLRNHLAIFALEDKVAHFFRGARESKLPFSWNELEDKLIFLRIPADKVDVWAPAINVITTQLIRHLERRPEMYSEEGKNSTPILLLLDEFARVGKLPRIANALATLRSKRVRFCLVVQSIAQLDCVYGELERRIIADNCGYISVFRANDAETQRYFSDLVGSRLREQHGLVEQLDRRLNTTGYSWQTGEVRENWIQPSEFAALEDVVFLHPHGFCRIEKLPPDNDFAERRAAALREGRFYPAINPTIGPTSPVRNKHAAFLTVEERAKNAEQKIAAYQSQLRNKQERLRQERAIDAFLDEICAEKDDGCTDPIQRREVYLASLVGDSATAAWLRKQAQKETDEPGTIMPLQAD